MSIQNVNQSLRSRFESPESLSENTNRPLRFANESPESPKTDQNWETRGRLRETQSCESPTRKRNITQPKVCFTEMWETRETQTESIHDAGAHAHTRLSHGAGPKESPESPESPKSNILLVECSDCRHLVRVPRQATRKRLVPTLECTEYIPPRDGPHWCQYYWRTT
jgi:hypothetical protein